MKKTNFLLATVIFTIVFSGCSVKRWGFVNKAGEMAIAPKYSFADNFEDGVSPVNTAQSNHIWEWRFINSKGDFITEDTYEIVGPFSEGLAPFCEKVDCGSGFECTMMGFLDTKGNIVIENEDYLAFMKVLDISMSAGSWGMMGGFQTFSPGFVCDFSYYMGQYSYGSSGQFRDGACVVNIKDGDKLKVVFIDKKGGLVNNRSFYSALNYSAGLAGAQETRDGKWGFVNKDGKNMIDMKYDEAGSFFDGLAPVKTAGKHGYIGPDGKIKIPFKYEMAQNFSNGIAAVEIDGKYNYIDTNGKELMAEPAESVKVKFTEGLAGIKRGGKWGFIDKKGGQAIPCNFDEIRMFREGLCAVKTGTIWGFIDKTGSYVLKPAFFTAGDFSGGLAPIQVEIK